MAKPKYDELAVVRERNRRNTLGHHGWEYITMSAAEYADMESGRDTPRS